MVGGILLNMELWFIFAVAAAVIGGVPSFIMKVAAHRGYNPELFIFYGSVSSVIMLIPMAVFFSGTDNLNWSMLGLAGLAGVVASGGGIFRILALRCIDTTIYFPLAKLVSPSLAIAMGVVFFSESFSTLEWLGLISGVTVPLLLVTRKENGRQNNLWMGLILVLVTGVLSALVALVHKYVSDIYGDVFWIISAAATGVLIGSSVFIIYKQGLFNFVAHIKTDTTKHLAGWALLRGVVLSAAFGCGVYAFILGGTLAIVHTIQSLYILIPIVLAIIFYKEHWNLQKVLAIVLSLGALALLG